VNVLGDGAGNRISSEHYSGCIRQCIRPFLFIIMLMNIIFSVWPFLKTILFLAPRICKRSHSARSITVDCDSSS
jgi:hypothetical protein